MLPSAAARAAFPAWRATPATERAAKLLELVEALGRRQEELARLDAADNGSPVRDMRIDVAIGMAELRYFAGPRPAAARRDDSRRPRPAQLHAARALRRRRPDRAVQPSDPVRRDEDRRPAGRRQYRRPQAFRADVAVDPRPGPGAGADLPARRGQRRHGLRRRGRRRARRASRRAADRVHRPGRDGPCDPGAGRGRGREDGDARVRRQEPDRDLPGRGSRRGARGRRARHELQLPGPVVRLDLAADRALRHPRDASSSGSRNASRTCGSDCRTTMRRRSARW